MDDDSYLTDLVRRRPAYRPALTPWISNTDTVPETGGPPCAHRGNRLGTIHSPLGNMVLRECRHPRHRETTVERCSACPDRGSTIATSRRTMRDILPRIAKGPRLREWAVGMTTAPRREPTLERSLASLIAAGWTDPRLFLEPGVNIPGDFDSLPRTMRDIRLGCWPNYYLALQELLVRHPHADAFMVVQDDVVFFPGDAAGTLREQLEASLWPEEDVGAVSIYCSLAYARDKPGWYAVDRPWVWGACAFIFPRASLVHFLRHEAIDWRLTGRAQGMRNIDIVVGRWQQAHGKSIWHPSPSLCQHVGDTSTLWPNSRASGKRQARETIDQYLLEHTQ